VNLRDRDPYIRRNLGPFALGEGLLRHYPGATLEALRKWSKGKDEIQRWNVAMALTTSWAAESWRDALEILRTLASDKRRIVWQAVSMGLENLLRTHAGRVQPKLRGWMKERALRVPVSTALAAVSR
jgi:hypothetical protein